MIGTVGSLVQETFKRWLLATSLYIVAALSASLFLGAFLGAVGYMLHYGVCGTAPSCALPNAVGALPVGLLAIAYAASDLGLIRLPRPTVMDRVPATWWQKWQPYKAALLYGGALGLGITTQITFSAFYILCAWCFVNGNVAYGALLMATYGTARAVVLLPVSWRIYRDAHSHERLGRLLSKGSVARDIQAVLLGVFGVELLLSLLR